MAVGATVGSTLSSKRVMALTRACGLAKLVGPGRLHIFVDQPVQHRAAFDVGGSGRGQPLPILEGLQGSSTKFTALVSRLGCHGGVTGQVLRPEIHRTESEVVVTFRVALKRSRAASCPGNDQVAYEGRCR